MSATMNKPAADKAFEKALDVLGTLPERVYFVLKEAEGELDDRDRHSLRGHCGRIHTACQMVGRDMARAAGSRDILQRALDYLEYQPEATLGTWAAFQAVTKLLQALDRAKAATEAGPWIQGVGYWPFGPTECKAWEASEAFRRASLPSSLDPNADRLVAILKAIGEDRQGMRSTTTIGHAAALAHRVLWGWRDNPQDLARYDRICRVISANDDMLDAVDMVEAAKDDYSPHARMVWLYDIVDQKLAPAMPPAPAIPAAPARGV